jgi:ubiquinone/menaquinone biosynthesis C-methylase UbiE
VLDVGCGGGYFTRVMAQAVAPGGTAQGVDPSGEAIAQAKSLTHLANCTFSDGVAEALDAPCVGNDRRRALPRAYGLSGRRRLAMI